MTYKKIYNQLEKAGLIEKILANSNFDKTGLIKGIKYLESFLNSHTFKSATYKAELKADKTILMVCREYAKLQIKNNEKHINKFKYMSEVM